MWRIEILQGLVLGLRQSWEHIQQLHRGALVLHTQHAIRVGVTKYWIAHLLQLDMASESLGGGKADERIYYDKSLHPSVCQFLKRLDEDDKGYVDASTLDKFRVVRSSQAAELGKSSRTTRVTPSVLAAFDFDGDGQIESKDLQMAFRQKNLVERHFQMPRKLVFGLVCSIVLVTR
eukprot:1924414-Amphidinium_carterae.3